VAAGALSTTAFKQALAVLVVALKTLRLLREVARLVRVITVATLVVTNPAAVAVQVL
jgi:hypothetical protein